MTTSEYRHKGRGSLKLLKKPSFKRSHNWKNFAKFDFSSSLLLEYGRTSL